MSAGSDFASLNSWSHPGWLYQAAGAEEIVAGGPGDWPLLREALARRHVRVDAPHPPGAAIGFFRYDGSFWFGFYPEIAVVPAGEPSPLWRAQAARWADAPPGGEPWQSNLTPEGFAARVAAAQEWIARGHIYQVNLAQRFEVPFAGSPARLFEHLMARSPAPGAAYLDTGAERILSASPELFLRVEGRRVVTRPIKGTRPRDRDPVRDQQLAYELMTDPKEQAELVMITDLERNDLGRICEAGSVTVTELLKLERYPQVFHLVSTVEGHLREEVDPVEAVAACFPGGSITGAPKRRAMEIIAELEPAPRGLFTGAIGYFGFNGDCAFSIAIRTMVHEAGKLHFHVGSGVTAGSDPLREYEETLHKARGLQLALEAYRAASRSVPSVSGS
ncbi:MAG: aminodeoxychorismate synthase component I [Verrucomicrobium sp.]|nr:aminodeoxychorismate synthase component I [Verrucomicrobium sp.]